MKIIGIEKPNTLQDDTPSVYILPNTVLLQNNKPFFLPEFSKEISCQIGLMFRICKVGKYIKEKYAHTYFDQLALGIQFTANDLVSDFQKQGHAVDLAKGFDSAMPISKHIYLKEIDDLKNLKFNLTINQETIVNGAYNELPFTPEKIIPYLSKFFITKIGDYIFILLQVKSSPLRKNDLLEGYINSTKVMQCKIK